MGKAFLAFGPEEAVRRVVEADSRCVAVPVFGAGGDVYAALSVAGPAVRVTPERVEDKAFHVRRAADEVTARVGGRPRLFNGFA